MVLRDIVLATALHRQAVGVLQLGTADAAAIASVPVIACPSHGGDLQASTGVSGRTGSDVVRGAVGVCTPNSHLEAPEPSRLPGHILPFGRPRQPRQEPLSGMNGKTKGHTRMEPGPAGAEEPASGRTMGHRGGTHVI